MTNQPRPLDQTDGNHMNPTLKGLNQWPNTSSLPPSSPEEAFSGLGRVETAVINPEWIIADFEMGGKATPWREFIHAHWPAGRIKDYTMGDMKAAFRAGFEAGRNS
jgi:hypothetical protein